MFKATQEFEPVCSEEETEITSKGMKNNMQSGFEFNFFFNFILTDTNESKLQKLFSFPHCQQLF